jgi:hypothetical protein
MLAVRLQVPVEDARLEEPARLLRQSKGVSYRAATVLRPLQPQRAPLKGRGESGVFRQDNPGMQPDTVYPNGGTIARMYPFELFLIPVSGYIICFYYEHYIQQPALPRGSRAL